MEFCKKLSYHYVIFYPNISLLICRPLYDMGDVAEHKLLLKKIEQTFPELDSAGCLRVYANVLKCVEKKDLVSSFV